MSLHGRAVEALHPHLLPGNRILALASDRTTIDQVVEILVNRGYGASRVITTKPEACVAWPHRSVSTVGVNQRRS